MKIERPDPENLVIEFGIDEGRQLARDVIKQAEGLPSAVLDLANLLRAAGYAAKDEFRQPPDPWEPGSTPPPSV